MGQAVDTELGVGIGEPGTLAKEREHPSVLLPYLALAFGVLAIGSSGILVKWANVPGTVNGFFRMGIAAAVVALPFAINARREAPLSRFHIGIAILAGLFFAGDLATWNTAVLMTSAANATLFGNTSPLWVGIGAMLLFKERLRPAFWGGLALAMVGVMIILGEDVLTHPTLGIGDLLGLLAGFFYGIFFLAAERARDRLSSLSAWWISAVSSALALLVASVLLGHPLFGYSMSAYANLVVLALVIQVGGWLAINYALGHLRASLVAPTLLAQPVLTALLGVPLLNEPLTPAQILGGAIVIAGILIVHKTRS